jgi:acetolactate decarboxylase
MKKYEKTDGIMYQVSTLQALALGYTKPVTEVSELLAHGDTGLGTFEDVNGEMIVAGGRCWQAADDGAVKEATPDTGVPFASVTSLEGGREFSLGAVGGISALKTELDIRVEEDFGLNSMHVARIDGVFEVVRARSEAGYRSHHVELKDILGKTQKDFSFENTRGTLVCVYYPDYMDGINAPGWHLHYVSEDRTQGGHVFELSMIEGHVTLKKISRIEIQLPWEPAFDTYALKEASGDDIKKVEQGSK